MMSEIPLYIPQFDRLLQGVNYDMAEGERASHSNNFTTHPIEDPERSFLIDHNREEPTELSVTLSVSTTPCFSGASEGADRINQLVDDLLAMRAAQSTSVGAFLKVFTGLRVYPNMAISRLDFTRSADTPNAMLIDIDLIEFRFAVSPRLSGEKFIMHANNGARDTLNRPLVLTYDRPIAEATRVRRSPRFTIPLPSHQTMIRAALRRLGAPRLAALDIAFSSGAI